MFKRPVVPTARVPALEKQKALADALKKKSPTPKRTISGSEVPAYNPSGR